jgi:hypothetical protein
MTRDAERRIESEIEGVLNSFGLDYKFVHSGKHAAVQFEANGKRTLFHYSGGDPRAHLNARSDLRNLLYSAGLQTKKPEVTPTPEPELEPEAFPDEVIDAVEVKAEPVEPVEEFLADVSEPITEPLKSMPINSTEYAVHQVRNIRPAQVIAIELDRDLMCAKGTVLVVPLNKPNMVMDLTREQFDVMFEQVAPMSDIRTVISELLDERGNRRDRYADMLERTQAQTPIPRPTPPPPPPPPLPPDEEEPEELPPAAEIREPHVSQFAEGISGLHPKRPRGRPPKLPIQRSASGRAQNWVHTPYRDQNPRSIEGMSPQQGRILAGMVHVGLMTGHVDILPDMLNNVVLQHDRHQYSSRTMEMRKLGLLEQGLPVPGTRSSYHLKVTPLGRKMVQKIGHWPWLYDGLDIPRWAQNAPR